MYSEKVMDHFMHPRNVGEIENADGIGEVGNAKCGDIMRIYLKIDNGIITDVKFKTFGCGAAVATSSMATELIKGKSVDDALKLTNKAVIEALDGEQIYEIEHDSEEYLLELRRKAIQEAGLKPEQIRVHLRFGNPKLVIVEDFQPEYENDLIIVGSTGKNFLQRLVVGSVAAYVIRSARCDVLVARTKEEDVKE